jgi:hypothetical protein
MEVLESATVVASRLKGETGFIHIVIRCGNGTIGIAGTLCSSSVVYRVLF